MTDRREFIGAAAAALFAGVLIQITGCTTDDKTESNHVPAGSVVGFISDNHADTPHKAVITKAQLDAGGGITLDIQGAAPHTHTLTLSADEMATIKAGNHVMGTTTTTEKHSHTVMLN